MQIRYFDTSWNDVKHSPGWFGKMCLLALIMFIPIFGFIVVAGYLFGWAREVAWGVHEPLPERIFGNEDGRLYRRGVHIFVLNLVLALVVAVIMSMLGVGPAVGLAGLGTDSLDSLQAVTGLASFYLVYLVVSFLLNIVQSLVLWVGAMRMSIYDRMSAGFQLGKMWKMFRHDTGGILRVWAMNFLVSLVIGLVLGVVFGILLALVGGVGLVGMLASFAASGYSSDALAGILAGGGLGAIGGLSMLLLVASYASSVVEVFVLALTARAMGYWTMQFDVPRWRGQDDPMPFEVAAPIVAPVAAPAAAPAAAPVAAPAQQVPMQQAPGAWTQPVQQAQPAVQVAPAAQVAPAIPQAAPGAAVAAAAPVAVAAAAAQEAPAAAPAEPAVRTHFAITEDSPYTEPVVVGLDFFDLPGADAFAADCMGDADAGDEACAPCAGEGEGEVAVLADEEAAPEAEEPTEVEDPAVEEAAPETEESAAGAPAVEEAAPESEKPVESETPETSAAPEPDGPDAPAGGDE